MINIIIVATATAFVMSGMLRFNDLKGIKLPISLSLSVVGLLALGGTSGKEFGEYSLSAAFFASFLLLVADRISLVRPPVVRQVAEPRVL